MLYKLNKMRNHRNGAIACSICLRGYFGIVLGTIGMGFAALCQPDMGAASHWPGDIMVICGDDYLGTLDLAFLSRLVRFPRQRDG